MSQRFSEGFGPRGYRVRIYERYFRSMIHFEHRDPTAPHGVRRFTKGSLEHRDRAKARAWALRRSDELRAGYETGHQPATASRVFGRYLQFRSVDKAVSSQKNDERCAKMWTRILKASDLHKLDTGTWERFRRERSNGTIDANGKHIPPLKRVAVTNRTVRADLQWFRTVLRWATRYVDVTGDPLIETDPTQWFALPSPNQAKRPVASQDRFEAIVNIAGRVTMQVRRPGWRGMVRSYLAELLEVVNGTGRRISAVRQLQVRDLQLRQTSVAPHGAILWPAGTDKRKKEWWAPLSAETRSALEQRLASLPDKKPEAYLFPSPSNPTKPVSKELCRTLLRRAEVLAKLEPLDGSQWHAYRRKFATERKHLPDKDVAEAGGWSDLRSLREAYQQPDAETMYQVVSQPHQLREVK